MKPIAKIVALILLVGCFIVELYLLRAYKSQLAPIAIASAAAAAFFLFAAWCLNKTEQLFVTVFNAFKAGLASILGLLLIIYAALHIGWLGNYIANFIENGSSLYPALMVASFFCLPFFLIPFLYTPSKPAETPPQVLITTLSWNRKADIETFIQHQFDREKIEAGYPSGKFWNWYPIIEALQKYSTIQTLYLLISEDTAKELEGIECNGHRQEGVYKYMLEVLGLGKVTVHLIKTINPQEIDLYKQDVEKKLTDLLNNKTFADEVMLFDLTGGTAIASVAMVLLAYKGKRRAIYKQQGFDKKLTIFNPDTQSFRELWQQILESL
jgi:hypothetical protein